MIPDKVKKVLDAEGLAAIEFEAGSTPTSIMAAEKLGVTVGQIAKSLLFKGKNDLYFLICCTGDKRIASSVLKRIAGTKLSMTSQEETDAVTGFRPGGVCPFGVQSGPHLQILLDEDLGSYDTIYPAAGNDASGVPMTFEQLKKITGGRIVKLADPAEAD